jgi:PE family
MSLLIAAPESMTAAATDLANMGSALSAAHTAAATSTVAVIPAAADEVSAGIAHLFSQHAQEYQALAGRAAAFQEQFVQHLTSSAGSYAGAEAASAASLQSLSAAAGSIAAPADAMSDLLTNAATIAILIVASPIIAIVVLPFLALIGLALALLLGFAAFGLAAGGLAYLASLIFAML